MLLSPRDRINARADMKAINTKIKTVIESSVVCPSCGFDEFTQSGKKADCETCNGTGKIVTKTNYIIMGRVSYPKLQDMIIGVAGSIDVGDAIIYTSKANESHMLNVKSKGYIIIENQRYGIKSISNAGFGGIDELVIWCSRQTQ